MFGINKNGTKHKIGIIMPAFYPASRVTYDGGTVEDALNSVSNESLMAFKTFNYYGNTGKTYTLTLDTIDNTDWTTARFPCLILSINQGGYQETIGVSVDNENSHNNIYFSSASASYDKTTKTITVNTTTAGLACPMLVYPRGRLTFVD